jgi:hypothetical protein
LASRARVSLSRSARSSRLIAVRSVATASSPTMAPVSSRIADSASNTGRVRPRWWCSTNSCGGSRCWANARNAVQSGGIGCPYASLRRRDSAFSASASRIASSFSRPSSEPAGQPSICSANGLTCENTPSSSTAKMAVCAASSSKRWKCSRRSSAIRTRSLLTSWSVSWVSIRRTWSRMRRKLSSTSPSSPVGR